MRAARIPAPAGAAAAGPRWLRSARGSGSRASGPGAQELTWSVESGRWTVVVMRPDGSRGVSADLAARAKLRALLWVSIVALAFGPLVVGGGGAMIYFGAREPRARTPPAT